MSKPISGSCFLLGAHHPLESVSYTRLYGGQPEPLIKVKGPLSFHQSHFIIPSLPADVHNVFS